MTTNILANHGLASGGGVRPPNGDEASTRELRYFALETGDCALEKAEFEAASLPHMNDLYRAAVRMLNDPARASDAVQETYLIAWKSFGKFRRGTNCKAWLFQILLNVVRHERRRWFKWITGAGEDVRETQIAAPEPIAGQVADREILAALDSLPAPFREALLLVDAQEFSYKEASQILGVPIGTIMSRLNRARTLLRKELAEVAKAYGLSSTRAGG